MKGSWVWLSGNPREGIIVFRGGRNFLREEGENMGNKDKGGKEKKKPKGGKF